MSIPRNYRMGKEDPAKDMGRKNKPLTFHVREAHSGGYILSHSKNQDSTFETQDHLYSDHMGLMNGIKDLVTNGKKMKTKPDLPKAGFLQTRKTAHMGKTTHK